MLYDNEKIKALMVKRGLSGNELAKLAGIAGPSMHILKGETKSIKDRTLLGLANALGVSMQEIMKKGGKKPSPDDLSEAVSVFTALNPANRQAMLVAMRSLAASQGKKD